MKNIKRYTGKKTLLVAVLIFSFGSVLMACGASKESALCRSWYLPGYEGPSFTFYSDGTCDISGEAGAGSWAIVNGDTLKLSTFWGETETATIKQVNNQKLVLGSGSDEITYYSSPQE